MGIVCSWLWVHNSPIIYWQSLLVCKSSWDIHIEMQNSFLLVTHQICTWSIFPLIRYYIDFCSWRRETCNALLCEGTKGEGTKVWIFMFSVLLVKAQQHVVVHCNVFISLLDRCQLCISGQQLCSWVTFVLQNREARETGWVSWTDMGR